MKSRFYREDLSATLTHPAELTIMALLAEKLWTVELSQFMLVASLSLSVKDLKLLMRNESIKLGW